MTSIHFNANHHRHGRKIFFQLCKIVPKSLEYSSVYLKVNYFYYLKIISAFEDNDR